MWRSKIGNSDDSDEDDSSEENGLQQIMTHQRHGERSLFSFVTSRYERFSFKYSTLPNDNDIHGCHDNTWRISKDVQFYTLSCYIWLLSTFWIVARVISQKLKYAGKWVGDLKLTTMEGHGIICGFTSESVNNNAHTPTQSCAHCLTDYYKHNTGYNVRGVRRKSTSS